MGLENLSWFSALLRSWLSPLVREREGRFSNKCEHNLRLITLVDVLIDAFAVANLGRRKRMDVEAQVSDNRFAHFLLVCNGSYREFPGSLLNQREG